MESEVKNTGSSSKIKILLVDDNVDFLNMLNEFLVDESYEVKNAEDGKSALTLYSEFLPDIVVTDIVMPEVDGIELLLNIRKLHPTARVIAMSGGNSGHAATYLRMAEKLGANAILNKPFELIELVQHIKNVESNV